MIAVLFDLDDTLFDHRYGTRAALAVLRDHHEVLGRQDAGDFARRHAELLERLHVDVLAGRLTVDEARVRRFTMLFEEAGHNLTAADAAAVAEQYRDAYLASWRLVPGALALLTVLRRTARLGIVTNNVVSEQTRKVRALGLEPLVDVLVISEAVGVSKPDPRIFAIALDRLQCRPVETVMVGDSWTTDVVGAAGAGLRAVWFNPDGRVRPDPEIAVVELASFEPADAVATKLGHFPFPETKLGHFPFPMKASAPE